MSAAEEAVVARLLSSDFDGVEALQLQAAHIMGVESNCTCGCPSLTPSIDRSLAPPIQPVRTKLSPELLEIDRQDGVGREVLSFADGDGYLANIECVYYDDPIDEWPDPTNCALVLRDDLGYVVSMQLPSGATIRPQISNDAWSVLDFAGPGLIATTFSGWREEFDAEGGLRSRTFVK